MNTATFITKGLRFRPYRTLFLLLGFAVGVMVMTVLLSVGSAVLEQALDEDLTGGGDVVLLPAGIDVNVLKTGGVTAMNFDIPNARYLTREFLTPDRIPGLRNVSPEITRTYATLSHDGQEQLVRMDGVVPSRFASLWPAFPAALHDGAGERTYTDPDFIQELSRTDAFHQPVLDSTRTWAEWHYFNYHDDAGRSLYVSINALAYEGDLAASGYSRGMLLFQYVDETGQRTRIVDVIPGREIAASQLSPDLTVGLNTVTWEGGSYRVSVAPSDSTGHPVTLEFDLEATPHLYVPPITPMGATVPFGYVVPVVRGHLTGRLHINGKDIALDGIGYHDHNWGHFRDAVWDWGVVHLDGGVSILYGRFARTAGELARQPLLFAMFDSRGPRPFVLTSSYHVDWARTPADSVAQPQTISMHARVGQDPVELKIDVKRRVESETGAGKQGLFRADANARSFFIQMEGTARLTGSIDRKRVDLSGHAFSETFRLERQTNSRQN
ncbi:MAG TPA: hypothetical protein VFH88_05805 [Candidatus Krumholzibacteria bacterium]|nr:hypothetical protein [Candidatus Krumholzibacteria bacterium]